MNAPSIPPVWSRGSLWYRWEPHIHTPGTVLNDQYGGEGSWDAYLDRLESVTPTIRAIGVTDYYGVTGYERVCAAKLQGRLPHCELIFPNVEMRLGIGTVRGAWVNIHLLASPEDSNHLYELNRFLARIRFDAFDDSFCCSKEDLIKLGRRSRPTIQDDSAALEQGCQQFKVSLERLRDAYRGNAWAERNILVAVAGGSGDGASGVRDGADATLREEIEKFAHVIFSGNPKDRDYWLGKGALRVDEIQKRYDRLKPCLHGSDAHSHAAIGTPANDRYCWIKGNLSFDTLRQACIDPEGRAYVGDKPPTNAIPSQVIDEVHIQNAAWMTPSSLQLNPGLIAIIGPRGSGKTALADIIAAGCDAAWERLSKQSFLERAREYLEDASVKLTWQGSTHSARRALGSLRPVLEAEYPRARYLSQQFVEDLCAADGMTDALLQEIERVVFEAHEVSERDGAIDFRELVELKAGRYRQAREREEEALETVSDRIGTELEKERQIPLLKKQIAEKTRIIAQYTTDRGKLVAKGSEERLARLGAVTKAAEKVRGYIRYYSNQEQALLTMKDEVVDVRQNQAPETLRRMKERHIASRIKDEDWGTFLLKYSGDVDAFIAEGSTHARERLQHWKGVTPVPFEDLQRPFVDDSADLEHIPLALLESEIARLQKLIGGDREIASKFAALSKRTTEEAAALERLNEKLADCEQAKQRITQLSEARQNGYVRVFEAVLAEQEVLTALYAPLMVRVAKATGALKKLAFTVNRVVDVGLWAKRGEELLDLRRQGPVRGRGTLAQRADRILKDAWQNGDAQGVAAAMGEFRREITEQELTQIPRGGDQADYRAWAKRLARWLYSTDHISIHYSVDYDGVDIRKLSPGTRGIVLLLLYLALDEADDRPLIIDQPEENLDPQSIFDELVGLFMHAKRNRQVIIVTHNANLVVNTDADQIIIANSTHGVTGQLPSITYIAGGLESEHIRRAVCNILEGGERAFKERARRLRVGLERR